MKPATNNKRIPEERLAEHWFSLRHAVFEQLSAQFRAGGLKQKDLASLLGKDEARISKWLKGRENLTLRTMSNIARAIGCRLEIKVRPLHEISQIPNFKFDQAEAFRTSKRGASGSTADTTTTIYLGRAVQTGTGQNVGAVING